MTGLLQRFLQSIICTGVCTFFLTAANGQEQHYFSEYFTSRVPERTKNVRSYMPRDEGIAFEDFEDGKLSFKGTVNATADALLADAYISYVRNNAPAFAYKDSFAPLTGEFTRFYKSQKASVKFIVVGQRLLYTQVWDEQGNELLINGTGRYSCITDDKTADLHTVYVDSLISESYSVRTPQGDTIYYKVDEMAMPREGLQQFSQELVRTVKYPTLARFVGQEGRAYISFIVDKNGKLTEFKPISNEGFRFETKVIRKLEEFPNWNPARLKGRAVSTAFVLPVVYKLK